MAKGTGILIDPATGDLQIDAARDAQGLIARGLAVGDILYQNQALILRATPGEYKEYPTLGAALSEMLNDEEITGWNRLIALQLEADDMRVARVDLDLTNHKLTIDAEYHS